MKSMEPSKYDPSSIKPVRPPDVEGEIGRWNASWQLTIAHPIERERLRAAEAAVSASTPIRVRMTLITDHKVRLETTTDMHPLDVEAWPIIDSMLMTLDRLLDLIEINDCPREWWRPFR
jgi:hypothetical protein